jgi:PTH1 family peptidyl-tRNA hydrolase
MNLSGQSVGEAMRFFKLTPADIVVFHDELDLAPGKLRVKTGGGNGGHNGLRSIDAHIGLDYRRVRMGIGHPGNKDLVTPYVLSDFTKQEHKEWLDALLDAIAVCAEYLTRGEDDAFQSRVAAMMKPNPRTENPSKDNL